MSKTQIILSVFFALGYNLVFGQENGIDFRVQDEHGIPVESAEVRFVQVSDSTLIGTQYTGRNGLVINSIQPSADLAICLTAPGRQTVWWQSKATNEMGIVTLMPDLKGKVKRVSHPSPYLSTEKLNGQWEIDLRPSPDAKPYLQTLFVQLTDNKYFSGSFYDTSFENGIVNTAWDGVHFAFTTEDRKAEYVTVGFFDGEKLQGVTYCELRDFVMPWSGKRK